MRVCSMCLICDQSQTPLQIFPAVPEISASNESDGVLPNDSIYILYACVRVYVLVWRAPLTRDAAGGRPQFPG